MTFNIPAHVDPHWLIVLMQQVRCFVERAQSLHSFLFLVLCLGEGCYMVSARQHVYLDVLKINIPDQSNQRLNFFYGAHKSLIIFFCPSETSNLLVMTRDREPVPQRQPQVSQLSFHRILKEEIVQVIFLSKHTVDFLHGLLVRNKIKYRNVQKSTVCIRKREFHSWLVKMYWPWNYFYFLSFFY